jgi:SAM-dependent methyltransferase
VQHEQGLAADAVRVDTTGLHLPGGLPDDPLDVRFDDHWVWSLNPARDGVDTGTGLDVRWPEVLVPHLAGRSRVRVHWHNGGPDLFDDEVVFTGADRRVSVVDQHGNHLAVDKSGRLQRKFDDTADEVRGQIVDTVNRILADLRGAAGLDAFLAFGCLLGAIRDGRMIGHDADADVAYVSRFTHPLDIIRENRAAARVMRGLGYQVVQMSAADFKIWVPLPDGRRCGVDVFGGYYFEGTFHLLPTVRGQIDRTALLPPSTVSLEGRRVIGPAQPEALLELTYGPGWRVPDPSFRYQHPRDLTRHMEGYWRGARNQSRTWGSFYRGAQGDRLPRTPSGFARWVEEQLSDTYDVVDVGAGNGRDAVWFAQQGRRVLALDFVEQARQRIRDLAAAHEVDVEVGRLNLNDTRTVLVTGARLAHDPRPRHVYARCLLDGVSRAARAEFYRFADMVSRRGGLTFVELGTEERVSFEDVVAEIEERGGVVEQSTEDLQPPVSEGDGAAVRRLVVRWKR